MLENEFDGVVLDNSLKPSVNLLTIFRLGLFNLGIGLFAVLTVAVLNRIMITELAIPAWITAAAVAMPNFVSPSRVWFGQMSDQKPLFGLYRTGYVRIGMTCVAFMVFLAVQVVWKLGAVVRANEGWLWSGETMSLTALLAFIFILYGIALGASSTPFTALLVDISQEETRPKLVAIVWSMLMVGIVIGGITGKVFLKNIPPLDMGMSLQPLQQPINQLFIGVAFVVIILTFIATWGIEKKYSHFSKRSKTSQREENFSLKDAINLLTHSRQTGFFFSFLLVITLGLFLQEAVLEPYGGDVFKMSIADTTALNSFWGIGILIGYSITGFLVVPRFGKKQTAKLGCLLVAFSFLLIVLSGFTAEEQVLKGAMLFFGGAAGMTTIASISLMLDLTVAETAGTFIGAWGLSQSLGRGIATFSGGLILDLGKFILPTTLLAYSLVFCLQALLMFGAIAILNQVNVEEFKKTTQGAISMAMQGDLD